MQIQRIALPFLNLFFPQKKDGFFIKNFIKNNQPTDGPIPRSMEKNLREFWSKHLTAEQALRNLVSCVAVCLVKQYFLQCGTARQTPCRIFHLWRRILLERTTQPWPFLLMARRSPARFRAGFFYAIRPPFPSSGPACAPCCLALC